MERIKIVFKASSVKGNAGSVCFQVHFQGKSFLVRTRYKVQPEIWPLLRRVLDGKPLGKISELSSLSQQVAMPFGAGSEIPSGAVPALPSGIVPSRAVSQLPSGLVSELPSMASRIRVERERLKMLLREKSEQETSWVPEDIQKVFTRPDCCATVFGFMRQLAESFRQMNRVRTAETYEAALRSFMGFRQGVDLKWNEFDALQVGMFEAYLKGRGVVRNTSSFYMRILRAVYNRAVEKGLTLPTHPFRRVYTGVDKTVKRAISLDDIRKIKQLDLSDSPSLDFSRDMFLFSFYVRGMSFVDMAYLRKDNLCDGVLHYCRRKTGQGLSIRWEACMQEIVDKQWRFLSGSGQGLFQESPYLLPILRYREDSNHYRNRLLMVNRCLKAVAGRAGLDIPLTMYVARHSWASAAWRKNVPVSVISEGMGHDSELTTRIYLASIDSKVVDAANRMILEDLRL